MPRGKDTKRPASGAESSAPLGERAGFPQPPEHLGNSGRNAWELGVALWKEGVIKQRDLLNWQLFAEAWDEKADCEKVIAEHGRYQCAPNGCYAEHPAVKRRDSAECTIRKYSVFFGLLPDARKKRPAAQQGVASRPK